MFLVTVSSKDSRITGVHKWEQAFRVYATIYCGANPHRSKEIWQYISVINSAASAYSWENVASYDYTFRHLMAFNPKRSWAITYNQMWNLCMRDPLPRNNHNQNRWSGGIHLNHGGNITPNGFKANNANKNSAGRKKSYYCWNWNKGVKCKFGSSCKFIERCSYCDSPNHGIHVCPKAQSKKESDNTQRGRGQGQTPNSNNQAEVSDK